MGVSVCREGLRIDNKVIPLISGAVHYWRLKREYWSTVLDRFVDLGFRFIETYIPWSVHEIRKGRFDFGSHDTDKDTEGFLSECEKRGLYILVRPGPHINAELTYFGYPKRILKDKRNLSRSRDDTPVILPYFPRGFPLPSYASDHFYKEFGLYLDTLCPILERHLHPRGGIVAVQVDNEMSMFFRTSAYDHDYSHGALDLYHDFLREKYEHIGNLNDVYRSRHNDFNMVPMPKDFEAVDKDGLPYYLDWMEYKEYYMIRALKRIKGMLQERGMGDIPVYHNYPGYPLSPFNLAQTEEVIDIQGIDIYPSRHQHHAMKRICLYLSGMSRLPYLPEFSSGFIPWGWPIGIEDQRFTSFYVFSMGIKSVNFYMAVERERWYGSPITRHGRTREEYYDFFHSFLGFLKETKLHRLERERHIILLSNRDYERLQGASNLFSPVSPLITDFLGWNAEYLSSEERLGFPRCIQIEHCRLWESFYHGMEGMGYPFDLGDTLIPLDRLKRYMLTILPCFDFLSSSAMKTILRYVQDGGTLFISPMIPYMDERMEDCGFMTEALKKMASKGDGLLTEFRLGSGRVFKADTGKNKGEYNIKQVEYVLRNIIARLGIKRSFRCDDNGLELSFHSAPDGAKGILFLINPSEEKGIAKVFFNGIYGFKDRDTGRNWRSKGSFKEGVPPFTVKVIEVKK